MRHAITLFAIALLFPAFTYAVDNSATSSSDAGILCPDNSSLKGSLCYCNAGFTSNGASCVKVATPPPPAAPSGQEVYEDIRTAVALNSDLTCAQLGIAPADMELCQRFLAATNKSDWKSIPRPSNLPANTILNPWDVGGQQIFSGGASSMSVVAALPKPPAPPPAPATTTPDTPPAPSDKPADPPVAKPEPAVRKLPESKTPAKKEVGKITEVVPDAPGSADTATTTPEAELPTSTPPETQLASALAAHDLVKMSSILALMVPPDPEPVPASPIQVFAPTPAPEPPPEKPKSFFENIKDWFFSLF